MLELLFHREGWRFWGNSQFIYTLRVKWPSLKVITGLQNQGDSAQHYYTTVIRTRAFYLLKWLGYTTVMNIDSASTYGVLE